MVLQVYLGMLALQEMLDDLVDLEEQDAVEEL